MKTLFSVLALGLAAAGGVPAPALAQDAPAASPPPAKSCLSLAQVNRTEVLDDSTIIFHSSGRQMWK